MKLVEAAMLANNVLIALHPFCSGLMIAGSIRREKAEVGDVDIVAMPKAVDLPGGLLGVAKVDPSTVWKNLIPQALLKSGLHQLVSGQELHRFSFPEGLSVDIYRARPETWGVILLVRTGSKEHNVKLCILAKYKGLKLIASEGKVSQEGFGKIIARKTEEEIFRALGLAFVEPRNREVYY